MRDLNCIILEYLAFLEQISIKSTYFTSNIPFLSDYFPHSLKGFHKGENMGNKPGKHFCLPGSLY